MSSTVVAVVLVTYFALVMLVSRLASRRAVPTDYFVGNRRTPWPIIAVGMIGVSISGISIVSVPGGVVSNGWYYLQMVLGYPLGYIAIAYILIPIYYRLGSPSIYSFLRERLGVTAQRTAGGFFLVSRGIVASLRLYVVAALLHAWLFSGLGVPFAVTIVVTLLLIWLYSFKAGTQALIYTDLLQTVALLVCVVASIVILAQSLDIGGMKELYRALSSLPESRIFNFGEPGAATYFWKQFLSGALIPFAMTGLDQDMMQKNLGCRDVGAARRNMLAYGVAFIPVNVLLLTLGLLLVLYARAHSVELPVRGDDLYPLVLGLSGIPMVLSVLFMVSLIAAVYSSADSALTSLATSFTIDILGRSPEAEGTRRAIRYSHVGATLALGLLIGLWRVVGEEGILHVLFTAVGYAYGPLLGLFVFSLVTRRVVLSGWIPWVCVASPLLSWGAQVGFARLGYTMGYELLLLNGIVTFVSLFLASHPQEIRGVDG